MMLQHDGIAVAGPPWLLQVFLLLFPLLLLASLCIMMLQHDGIAVAGPLAVASVSAVLAPSVAGVLAS